MQRTTPVREFGRRNLPESVEQTGRRGSILAAAHARREAKEAERLAREAAERLAFEKQVAERKAARQALMERLDPRQPFLRTAQKTVEAGLKGGQRSLEIAGNAVAAGRDGLDQAGEACEAGLRQSREALEALNTRLKGEIADGRRKIDAGVSLGRDGLVGANRSLQKSLKANGEQLSTRVLGAVESIEQGVKGGRAALERANQKLAAEIASNKVALRDGLVAGRSGLDSANLALKKGVSTGQESIRGANASLSRRIASGRQAIEVGLKGSRASLENVNQGLARRINSGRRQVREGLQAGASGVGQARQTLRQRLADSGKAMAETSRNLDARINTSQGGLRENLKEGLSGLEQANARLVSEIGKQRIAINGAIDASVTSGRQAIADAQTSLGEAAAEGQAAVRQAAPKALSNLLWIAGAPIRGLGHLIGDILGAGARVVGLITGLLIVFWTWMRDGARTTAKALIATARGLASFATGFASLGLRSVRLVGRAGLAFVRFTVEKLRTTLGTIWGHLRQVLAWLGGWDWSKFAFRAAPASLAAVAIFFGFRADIDWQSLSNSMTEQPAETVPVEPQVVQPAQSEQPSLAGSGAVALPVVEVASANVLESDLPAEVDPWVENVPTEIAPPPSEPASAGDARIAEQSPADLVVRVHRNSVPEQPVLTAAARIAPNPRAKPNVPGPVEFPRAAAPVSGGKIAIVIDDMGMDLRNFNRFMSLPAEINFAFLPYAENLERLTGKASASGHELLVHMPMEPKSGSEDPGPNALLTGLPDKELARRIVWNLERFDGFVGINNHMGSLFTENFPGMSKVMGELKRRELFYLDSLTTPSSTGFDIASEIGVNRVRRDVFLDNEREEEAILEQLRRATRIAARYGQAVAIGHPYKQTYAALKVWLAEIEGRSDVGLVRISALATASSPTKLASRKSASE